MQKNRKPSKIMDCTMCPKQFRARGMFFHYWFAHGAIITKTALPSPKANKNVPMNRKVGTVIKKPLRKPMPVATAMWLPAETPHPPVGNVYLFSLPNTVKAERFAVIAESIMMLLFLAYNSRKPKIK